MTRFAKYKKEKKKNVGEDATPWENLKKPLTEEEEQQQQRKEKKRLEKKRKRELKKV